MSVVTKKTVEIEVFEVDWISLAKAVENDVMEKLENDLATWHDDLSMRAMFLHDAADGLDVCALLAEGKWEMAEHHLRRMDTAAREYVWDFIENHSCEEFFDVMESQEMVDN